MAPSSKLTAFLALAAASPCRDAFAFSPSPQHSRTSVRLSARGLDEDVAAVADGWRKVSGGAAAFLTGMGIMTQVALADPSAIAPIDQAVQAQSSTTSSNVVLSIGAPTFGGGESFETLDFSMPSYGEATKGESITTSSDAPPDDGAAAAKAAAKEEAKEEAKRAAAEKAAAKKAEADAKEAAKKEAAAKAAAKAERLAAEKEKQRIVAERLKEEAAAKQAAKEEAPVAAQAVNENKAPGISLSIPDFKAPDITVPEIKAPAMPAMPSFSLPKIEMPKVDIQVPEMPEVKIPDAPKPAAKAPEMPAFEAPKMPAFEAPKMPAFEAPKIPSFSLPKVELPKLDVPPPPTMSYNLDTPTFSAPASSSVEEESEPLEPQEVRDARAAEKNVIFKEAKAEADEAKKALKIAERKVKEAKKVFKEAKGEACATRFGGKIICLRGFGVGY